MDEDGDRVLTCTVTSFKEHLEVMEILDRCSVTVKEFDIEAAAERMTEILNQYQELPHLLDPHIESIVLKILSIVMAKDCHPIARQQGFKYLYLFSKVRGPKYLARFLPHEVSDVEPVLTMLSAQDATDYATWETRYCLLLWLSVVCMIPFDLVRLDGATQSQPSETQGVVARILEIGKMYLLVSGKARDAASFLLAKFLTRPDIIKDHLQPFLEWTMSKFNDFNDVYVEGMAARSGLLATVAAIFKLGKREDLIESAKALVNYVVSKGSIVNSDNTLLRKYTVKLIQRIGLAFLKPRLAKWRYQRGGRSLLDNLNTKDAVSCPQGTISLSDDEEDYDIPRELETVIEFLLLGLRDKDTIVRWSAAKGIGRITSRLPQDLADDIIESILQLFNYGEAGAAWHGGCLALAEIGRRGLLLPARLPDVVPVIMKALVYDEIKGSYSAGSHVRDAACYVCWSFARAYDAMTMSAYVNQIASSLIVATIFDREVNCRRAAAAAFQENVGRQGSFPHGIDILTTADYFAVCNITHCYIDLSVYVAQYEEYTLTLIEHLAQDKLFHWDAAIRQLAAKALNRLVGKAPKHMATKILPNLLTKITSIDLNEKHGSLLGISEIVSGLAVVTADQTVSDAIHHDSVMNVIGTLNSSRQFRGHGEDLMRTAACKYIENVCTAGLYPSNPSIPDTWLALINECLCLPQQQHIYLDCASEALHAYCQHFYLQCTNHSIQLNKSKDDLIQLYMAGLTKTNNNRVGCSTAISRLPSEFLKDKIPEVVEALVGCISVGASNPGLFAESRRCAINAVTRVLGFVFESSSNMASLTPYVTNVITSLIGATKDYTTDQRGDIGSWVREAALNGLENVSLAVAEKCIDCLDEQRCKDIFCCVAKQAAEKIDRVRVSAGKVLENLLHNNEFGKRLPYHSELREIFSRKKCSTLNWASPADAFSAIVHLLHFDVYRYATLAGMVLSVGGLTESLVKHSSEQLLNHFSSIQDTKDELLCMTSVMLQIFSNHTKEDRVIVPLMKTLDMLLCNGSLDLMTTIPSCDLPEQIFVAIKTEIRNCGDAKKLIAAITILCGLMRFPGQCRKRSMSQLSIFLCHRFPRVRNETAEQYYTALLICDEIVAEDWLDEALFILSDTQWSDTDITHLRTERNKICRILGIPPPQPIKTANNRINSASSNRTIVDELSSYRDLVGRQDL